jgi:hypothetical protein
MENSENKKALCCTLNPSQMLERKKVLQQLHDLVREKTELENGFVFRFEGNDDTMDQIMEIIKLERQCCSFLTFNLTIEKEAEPVFLKITGPQGTKDFLLFELGL